MTQGQDKSKSKSKILALLVPGQVAIGLITLRDINRRSKQEVRGPRLLWKVWGSTNTFGSLMYWKVGRKPQLPAKTD